MKKTLMTLALAAATVPFTFAQAPANNAPAQTDTTQTKTTKKTTKAKKHNKRQHKAAPAATTANPTK